MWLKLSRFFNPTTLSSKFKSCSKFSTFSVKMSYDKIERGNPNTPNYRVYLTSQGIPISPFHDIPLFADVQNKIYNMVVEVPRWTNAKMEIATKEPLNPIKQDVKKDALRYVKNCFPHHGYIWNYGAFPQTWEDPNHLDEHTGCKGDNDPIDVCEIGERVHKRGSVVKVKVLGIFALIDEGETDWKVLAIDVNDPLSAQMNDINDIELLKTGLLRATQEWFKVYKIPDGKPENKFAFEGKSKGAAFAHDIVQQTHESWKRLITTPCTGTSSHGLDLKCVTIANSPFKIENPHDYINQSAPLGPAKPLTEEEQLDIERWYVIG